MQTGEYITYSKYMKIMKALGGEKDSDKVWFGGWPMYRVEGKIYELSY